MAVAKTRPGPAKTRPKKKIIYLLFLFYFKQFYYAVYYFKSNFDKNNKKLLKPILKGSKMVEESIIDIH